MKSTDMEYYLYSKYHHSYAQYVYNIHGWVCATDSAFGTISGTIYDFTSDFERATSFNNLEEVLKIKEKLEKEYQGFNPRFKLEIYKISKVKEN